LTLVHLHDIRMVQASRQMRFLDEHRSEAPGAAMGRQDALEDEDFVGTLCTSLFRQEYLGHAAGTEPPNDLELSDLRRRRRRGRLGRHRKGVADLNSRMPVYIDREPLVRLEHRRASLERRH
jgi:hypothetical protein